MCSPVLLWLVGITKQLCLRRAGQGLLPDRPLPAHIVLQDDGGLPHAQVLPPLAPPPEVLLDGDAGASQPVQTQFLQIGHLTGSEEDLCAAKPVLVGVLLVVRRK